MKRLLLLVPLSGCQGDADLAGGPAPAGETIADGGALPDTAVLPDAFVLPDMARPAPGCEIGDADGDGWGTSDACEAPDCDEANRYIHPGAVEACNGLDEDCDGAIDESLETAACGVGACRREVPNCADGRPQRCVPAEPAPEACNGADDDCDGLVDEEAAVETCGVGACARRASCEGGATGACTPGEPVPEGCNGRDDDCDGATDEGFRASTDEVPYGELAGRHDVCDGGRERIGPNCNAAMSRWCNGRDCRNTGFGPVENNGGLAYVTCVGAAAVEGVPFAVLAQHHAPCNGAPERIGPNCNAAIHRYCRARGHVSGFGPVESGPDALSVACVGDGAEVVGTRYSELVGIHDGCDGGAQRIGPHCNAAIHRFCNRRGFASGFGPVENSGDDLAVVCLRP